MTTTLELGDVIQLTAPSNPSLDEQIMMITYLDEEQVDLVNYDTLETITLYLENGTFRDESIESVSLLARSDEKGYARQNGLVSGKWVSIHIGGDLPTIIHAQITDLEEDMIELKTYPENATMYIDFGYQGIPKNIPIEKIIIRDAPSDQQEEVEISDEQEEDDETSDQQESTRKSIESIIAQANELVFTSETGEIIERVEVQEFERKYTIDAQINDLLNELIGRIPSQERTQRVMNNLHRILERFRHLYRQYSRVDETDTIRRKRFKGKDYKPLVERLLKLNANLFWLLPVSTREKVVLESSKEYVQSLVILERAYTEKQLTSDNPYVEYISRFMKHHDSKLTLTEPNLTYDTVRQATQMVVESMDNLISTVYHDESTRQRMYVIERFGLGMQRPLPISRQAIKLNPLLTSEMKDTTKPDYANITSMVMLNYPAIQYSRVHLPNTSLYMRVTMTPQTQWSMLRQSTSLTQQLITQQDLENGLTYMEDNQSTFLTDLKYIIMDDAIESENKYETFLKAMIPRTRELFDLISSGIENKLSFTRILEYLEPFYIYQEDLTFTQHKTIVQFMNKAILDWKRTYEQNKILRKPILGIFIGTLLLRSLFQEKDILATYDIEKQMNMTGLSHIMIQDGAKIVYSALANENTGLYSKDDTIQQYVERITSRVQEPALRIAKEYHSIDDLKTDDFNGIHENRDIEYTTTRDLPTNKYQIVNYFYSNAPDHIRRYRIEDVRQELKDYMIEQMSGKYKDPYTGEIVKGAELEKEVDVLLNGRRIVQDGDYAVLYESRMYQNEEGEDVMEKEEPQYYIREDQRWKKIDLELPQLEPETKQQAIEYIASQLLNQFNQAVDEERQQTQDRLASQYRQYLQHLKQYRKLREEREERSRLYIEQLAKQWKDTHTEVAQSPYQQLFQRIMGVDDFYLRQSHLIQFTSRYTHLGDNHYYLCNETGVSLVPQFLVELADAYQQGGAELYQHMLNVISSRQGVMSDSGDSIVDRYSGYVIRMLELSSEEGYDSAGFVIQSRDVLEDDRIQQEYLKEEQKQVRHVEIKMLMKTLVGRYTVRVIQALLTAMGIKSPFVEEIDYIVRKVENIIKNYLPPKEVYEKKKQRVSYEYTRNELIIMSTMAYLTVFLQIVPVRTNKTFPGCIQSFKGYPTHGADPSTYTYIACVANKLKTRDANPWSVLMKKKLDTIISDLKQYIDKFVLQDPQIIAKMKAAPEQNEMEIPEEHDVSTKWDTFLPPLRKPNFEVKGIKQFNEVLRKMIQRGSSKQHESIDKIRGRAIMYSLAIQDEIQSILDFEQTMLINNAGEPYLQNVCCEGNENTYDYFVVRNKKIQERNEQVQEFMDALKQVRVKASIYFDPRNTKLEYPPLSTEYTEENIYKAFIQYCEYNRGVPVSDDLTSICQSNQSQFTKQDTIEEKIKILKEEGVNYNASSLEQLLDIIHRRNYVDLYFEDYMETCRTGISEILKRFDDQNIETVQPKFQDMLRALLDTFEVSMYVKEQDETYITVMNFLMESNKRNRKTLIDFLKKNGQIERNTMKKAFTFLKQIDEWKSHETVLGSFMDTEDTSITYMRNIMQTICDELGKIYPNMILQNRPVYPSTFIPLHWNLGDRDYDELSKTLQTYLSLLIPYCGSEIIDSVYDDEQGESKEADDVVDRSEILGDQQSNLIKPVLRSLLIQTKDLLELMKKVPFLTKIGKEITSIFDARFVKHFMLYVFYTISNTYVEISKQQLTRDGEIVNYRVAEAGAAVDGRPADIAEMRSRGALTDTELDMVQAMVSNRKKSVANYLISVLSMFYDRKKLLNTNYDDIHSRILELKEKEKKRMTDKFEKMTQDQRNVQNLLKNNRIGDWGIKEMKGLTQYDPRMQDKERDEMIQQAILEEQGRNMGLTGTDLDVFMMDQQERMREQQEIDRDNEVYLPERDELDSDDTIYS